MPSKHLSGLGTATATAALLLFATEAPAQGTSGADWLDLALCLESDEAPCPELAPDEIEQAARDLAEGLGRTPEEVEAQIMARLDGLSVSEAMAAADEAAAAAMPPEEAAEAPPAEEMPEAPAEEIAETPAIEETGQAPAEEAAAEEPAEVPAEEVAAEEPAEVPAEEVAETPSAEEAPAGEASADAVIETEEAAPETANAPEATVSEPVAEAPAAEEAASAGEVAESIAESAGTAVEETADAIGSALEELLATENPEAEARAEELAAREAELAAAGETIETTAEAPTEEEAAEIEARREAEEAEALASAALEAVDEDSAETPAEDVAEVETETVTEETARTSSAEAARTSDGGRDDDTLRNILGAAAAAFVVGELLSNGDRVVERSDDRVVVNRGGEFVVLKDENTLLRRPGSEVRTEEFADGSTRTTVDREDGTRVVTVRSPLGRILYRARILPNGERYVLIDERSAVEEIDVTRLPDIDPRERSLSYSDRMDDAALAEALRIESDRRALDRAFSLRQVREVRELRELMPSIDLDAITFASGSAAIEPNQARQLAALGRAITRLIESNPNEVFLIEGHTDTVGSEVMNLALSDRRAESVALALTEYFDVPPENMVTQGYGERFLKFRIEGDVRENRRAAVRRITPLLQSASAN